MLNSKSSSRSNFSSKLDRNQSSSFNRFARYGNIIDTSQRRNQSKSLCETPKKYVYDLPSTLNIDHIRKQCELNYMKFTKNNNYSPTTAKVRFDTKNLQQKSRTKSLPNSVKMRSERSHNLFSRPKSPVIKCQIEQENEKLKTLFNVWLKEAMMTMRERKSKNLSTKSKKSESHNESSKETPKAQNSGDVIKDFTPKMKVKNELLKLNDFCKTFLKESRLHKDSFQQITQMYGILDRITNLLKSMKKKSQKNNNDEYKSSTASKPQKSLKELTDLTKSLNCNEYQTETDLSSIDACTVSSKNDRISSSKNKTNGDCKDVSLLISELKNQENKLIEKELINSKPVFRNYDKKLLGEIISYPKVTIHSHCTIGIHEKIIEEQFVIRTFRFINEQEKHDYLNHTLHDITQDLLKNDSIDHNYTNHSLMKKSVQTQTLNADSLTINFRNENSQISANILNEDVESLSWESDNLLQNERNLINIKTNNFNINHETIENEKIKKDQEMFSNMSKNVVSPILCEDNFLDEPIPDHIEDQPILQINCNKRLSNKQENVNQIMLSNGTINQLNIDLFKTENIDHSKDSIWTVHGSKIRNNFVTASIFDKWKILKSETHKQSLLDNIYKDENKSLNIKTTTNRLPPCIPLSMRLNKPQQNPNVLQQKSPPLNSYNDSNNKMSTKIDDSIKDLLQEKDVQLPENLSSLYDRLSKLQKMLECIPEERITSTLEALEQLDYSSISSPEMMKNLTEQYTNNLLKQEEKKMDQKLSETIDEVKSDVTPSLSMLENLIDDFLSKNGLTSLVGT